MMWDGESYCVLPLHHRLLLFLPRFSRLALTLTLCGHRYSKDHWCPLVFVLHEDQVKIRKDFWCYHVSQTSTIWMFSESSHTLRQPLLWSTIQRCLVQCRCSNLEVKKKSPLIGAGELKLKRESIHSWVLSTLFSSSPMAHLVEQSSSGRDVSFL